ncbi:MAG: helix-turn-helix domain-containing protein [Nitratireductor sp.]
MQANNFDTQSADVNKLFFQELNDSSPQKAVTVKPAKHKSRETYVAHAGQLILHIVSKQMNVSISDIERTNRGKANISIARQVVMYLMHTSMSCSYYEVADFLMRDRTTVSHGCRIVEDMRDQEEFEQMLEKMEELAQITMNIAASYSNLELPDVR